MKKLVFITCLLFVILGTTAQTIHWITFVDTTDRRVGKLDINGHEVLYNNFINDVNAALAEKGYESDNRVGGKRSSFSPTFVFRPLTPPYVRFRIRRFLFWVPFEIRLH